MKTEQINIKRDTSKKKGKSKARSKIKIDVCSRWNKERDRNFISGVFLTVRDKHKWNSKKGA